MAILKNLSGFQENISLADYTTFKIGGPTKYFFVAKNNDEIIQAVKVAQENNLPYFILGGGSNLLVSDEGFDGLVIKVQSSKLKIRNHNADFNFIEADSGVLLSRIVTEAVQNDLSGLEWAVGIPGTIGGAVVGNAGAYGCSISESVEEIKTLNDNLEVSRYGFSDCQFSYRDSVFKKKKEIILEVVLKLKKDNKTKSQQIIKEIILKRKNRIPPYPSAGSIFKNINIKNLNDFRKKISVPKEKIKKGMIPTAYLIEQCGLKGKQIGQAKIADEHANFIVNIGGAKAKDVITLINLCKEEVRRKFGIELEEEIRYLGF